MVGIKNNGGRAKMDSFWIWVLLVGLGLIGAVFTWMVCHEGDAQIDDEDIENYAEMQRDWKS